MDEPDNAELDGIFMRAATHAEVRVELCAAMLRAELYTLVPRGQSTRPAESVARPQGKNLPLIEWKREGKACYFVYTSARMARKGLRFFNHPPNEPMVIIGMAGEELLRRMYRPGVTVALNPGAEKYELTFDEKLLAGMLDGTLLESGAASEDRIEAKLTALRPEQYPLSLVQPVFDFLKGRPEALAAWVLQSVEAWNRGEEYYVIALLTTAEDSHDLKQSVGTVLAMVNCTDRNNTDFGVTTFDYSNPAHVGIMRRFVPFYAAPCYKAPSSPEP